MQPSARPFDTRDSFVQSTAVEPPPPDPEAVLRAYGGGVPSDRWKLDLKTRLVGAIVFVLAGLCLIMTVVLLLSLWLPAWLVTLGLTFALTALGLALFASVSRPPIYAPLRRQFDAQPATTQDLAGIEEIDPTEVESMRDPELASDIRELRRPRLTPHPIIAAEAVSDSGDNSDSDNEHEHDVDRDSDVDAKTRPLGEAPPAPSSRKPLRAELPSIH